MHIRLRIPTLILALSLLVPAVVEAAWVRVNHRACSHSGSSYNCALNEDDRLGHSTITSLNVYVLDNSASSEVWAVACRQNFDSSIGSCGAEDSTSVGGTPGHATLNPSLSAWSSSLGSGYIFVSGGLGSLQGYFASN